jgi:hypothetical protein
MTGKESNVPQSHDSVTGGPEGSQAPGGKSKARNARAIVYAIIIVIALALCAGAYYVASHPGPPEYGNSSTTPVPGHPEQHLKPVDAFYENGSRIYVLENDEARDPVYGQMISFVADDPSVYGVYEPGHSCSSFAVELIDNAEQCRIRAHFVVLTLSNSSPHAIVAFNTTDQGTVYIDNSGLTRDQIAQNFLIAPRIANVTPGCTYTRRYIGYDIDEDPGFGVVETVAFLS